MEARAVKNFNIFLLGLAFFLIFTAFLTIQQIQVHALSAIFFTSVSVSTRFESNTLLLLCCCC